MDQEIFNKIKESFVKESEKMRSLNKTKKSDDIYIPKILGGILFGLVFLAFIVAVFAFLICFNYYSYAFVLRKLWIWFLIPIFNLPAITLYQGMGLIVVWELFHHRHGKSEKTSKTKDGEAKEKITWGQFFWAYALPWIILGYGYILHHYFMKY